MTRRLSSRSPFVAVPASLRRLNERRLVAHLARLGVASRAELAKAAGISQPTAGKIIDGLLRLGVLRELNGEPSPTVATPRPGRPGRRVQLEAGHPRFVALELGVASTRLAAVPLAARVEDAWDVVFRTGRSFADWLARFERAWAEVRRDSLWGMLVSVPGVLDERAERVLYSPNLHWTERAPLAERLRALCGLPVLMVQEIRALALGHLAAHPACEDFLLVDFGEGVGGAVIEGGRLFSHPLPLSGELGHTPVAGNGRRCGCGAVGCVETLVSRAGLLESFVRGPRTAGAAWPDLCAALRDTPDPPWLTASLDAIATVIAGALNTLGLRHVVLTGCLSEFPPAVVERLGGAVQRGAMWARFGEVACETAARHRLAGLVAAGIERLLFPASDHEPAHRAARQRMREGAARSGAAPRGIRSPPGRCPVRPSLSVSTLHTRNP